MVKTGKAVKKAFFDVNVPLTMTSVQLYGISKDELIGRVVNLDLTRNLRVKNLELKMKVKKEGESLVGEPMSLNLAGVFIRRMMRKGSDYVEDSFIADCKDAKIVIKPFLITRNKVSRAVRNVLRVNARKSIEAYLKARNIREIFGDVMSNKIQKELSLKLKKIYPLALCEIRVIDILTGSEIKKLEEKMEEKQSGKSAEQAKEEVEIMVKEGVKEDKEEVGEEKSAEKDKRPAKKVKKE